MVLGVGSIEYGATKSGAQLIRQTGNLAFSGTEDLGGGLKASFRLETSIGGAAGTPLAGAAATTLGDRGAFLALESGKLGTLLVGRAASGIRGNFGAVGDVSRLAVPTGLSAAAGAQSAAGTTPAVAVGDGAARVIYGDAYSNQVAYQSPSISGFTVTVGVAPVEGNTSTSKDTMSYGVNYAQGPLAVRYNLTDVKAVADSGGVTGTGYKLTTLNGSYDLGVARVGITYQGTSMASGTNPGSAIALTANVPLGAGSIGLGYGKKSSTAAGDTRVGGDNVKQMFVGYRHDLSKRTHAQVVYNKLDRQGATTTNDIKETFLLIGHSF